MTTKRIERRGLMFVLSSPSGAGKTTLCQNLLTEESNLTLSVSVTTRARRGHEIDGTHYHFISKDEFSRLRDSEALLEWAEVHGNFYGTPMEPVGKTLQQGGDMLFDIDWQGATQIAAAARADCVSVFVLPPSMSALRERLTRRAEDSESVISERLTNASEEIRHWNDYDYVIINDDLDNAFNELRSILEAERLRLDRRLGLHEYVEGLLNQE